MKKLSVLLLVLVSVMAISLSACSTKVFKVSFIVDDEVYAIVKTDGGETINLSEKPTKEGYIFDGWYVDKDTWNKPFTANSLLNETLSSDMSVYAKWKKDETTLDGQGQQPEDKKDYTVTFDSKGGSQVDPQTVKEGNKLSKPTAPTREGYTFGGWYKEDSCTTEWNFEVDTISKSITLYAKWTALAEEPTEGIKYELVDNSYYVVTGYTGDDTEILIAKEYNDKPVKGIGDSAFRRCYITSVTIPEVITSIGNYAFYDCSLLKSITIPEGVTTIGNYAFNGCSWLKSVTFEKDSQLDILGNYAFFSCSSLTSITIPDSVTTIGGGAFSGCSGLTSITIPDSVTTIGEGAFEACDGLTSITIPDSVTTIGDRAFFSCSSLTSVTIGEGVTTIGDRAFFSCSSLTSVTIGEGVTTIGEDAFEECSGLTSVTIGEGVTTIGESAFSRCGRLQSITIPDSVTIIGEDAFYNCSGLTSITIGKSVTTIGNSAFYGCYKLVEVCNLSKLDIKKDSNNDDDSNNGYVGNYALNIYKANEGSSKIQEVNDFIFYDDSTEVYLLGYKGNKTELTLPEDYNGKDYKIYECAFYNCSGLTNVTIPDNVTTIGENAFDGCRGLTSVTIGEGVTIIGAAAFFGCRGLTSVTFENPKGWSVYESVYDIYNNNQYKTTLEETALQDESTAAQYLTNNYYNCEWKRMEEKR